MKLRKIVLQTEADFELLQPNGTWELSEDCDSQGITLVIHLGTKSKEFARKTAAHYIEVIEKGWDK